MICTLSLRILEGTFSIVLSLLVRCEAIGVFHRMLVGDLPLMVTSQTIDLFLSLR